MSVYTRPRKRDGATVYYIRYWAWGDEVREKVGAVKQGASKRTHDIAYSRALSDLQDRKVELDNGTWMPARERRAQAKTLRQVVDLFLENYRPRSGDIGYYRQRAAVWLEHLPADRPIAATTTAHVDRMRATREGQVGPSTVRKDLVSLSTFFRWAKGRRYVLTNPADADIVKRPSEPKHRTSYLTDDQEKKLLRACDSWLRLVIRWGIESGMDREEILLLSWRDVDPDAGVVHAPRRKTSTSREIPLDEELRAILRQAKRVRSIGGRQRVFLGPAGKPIPVDAAKTALRRAYATAQVHVSGPWKILRHTFGARAAMAGLATQDIAQLMGHTTETITQRYMHLSPDHLKGAMAKLRRARKAKERAAKAGVQKKKSEKNRIRNRIKT